MDATIYQIQITLEDSKPKIWRKLLVQSDTLLSDFHKIIQTTMGWTNSHLHHFMKDRRFYSADESEFYDYENPRKVDYKKNKIRISDLLIHEKDKISYIYDFGDNWEHVLILQKILPIDSTLLYPICLAGSRNCPPEDCGGIYEYSYILKILQEPDHEEHKEYKEWLGDDFDPKYFDKDIINVFLHKKNYGC